jgi:hypothetical protein
LNEAFKAEDIFPRYAPVGQFSNANDLLIGKPRLIDVVFQSKEQNLMYKIAFEKLEQVNNKRLKSRL